MRHAWNAEYRRWTGESVGVWQRRLSIARYGLRLCLAGRVIKLFLLLALAQSLPLAGVFFLFGQLVAPDSALILWLGALGGEQVTSVFNGLASWALLYPEIVVDGVYRIAFYLFTSSCPFFTVVTVALFVHRLIANDLASNAIVIYNSKALTRWDYLVGKFLVVATLLSLVWIAPVAISWLLGNALSPDWGFFVHSFPSLLRGLAVGIAAVASLSLLAMLVSSLAKKTGAAVAYWIVGWLILGAAANAASLAAPSLAYLSPMQAIEALSGGVYRLADLLRDARGMLPFFDAFYARLPDFEGTEQAPIVGNGAVGLPLLFLAAYGALSVFVVSRRVRA